MAPGHPSIRTDKPTSAPPAPIRAPHATYRPPRAARWQSLAALAGLVLASTCFLPAIQACGAPLIPIKDFTEAMSDLPRPQPVTEMLSSVLFAYCLLLAAYLFGLLEAIGALGRLLNWGVAGSWMGRVSAAFLSATAFAILTLVANEIYRHNFTSSWFLAGWRDYSIPPLVISICILSHMWRARKLGSRRWICQSFIGSLFCFLWFSFWFVPALVEGRSRYGLYLSWGASAVLLLAVIAEAREIARTSWLKTVGLLIISRLPDGFHTGHCPQCDYNLFGLPEPRCPECGRPFTPDEIGATNADQFIPSQGSPRPS